MKVGEKARLAIRSDYGYGSRSMGANIPANSNLNFDVELLGFKEKEKERWDVSAHASPGGIVATSSRRRLVIASIVIHHLLRLLFLVSSSCT